MARADSHLLRSRLFHTISCEGSELDFFLFWLQLVKAQWPQVSNPVDTPGLVHIGGPHGVIVPLFPLKMATLPAEK